MEARVIHDKSLVHEFLKNKIRYDYIYQFGNLSNEIWKKVICYGLFDGEKIKEIAMINMNYDIPVLLAASFENIEYSRELIGKTKKFLPAHFYTHIDKSTLNYVFPLDEISDLDEYINMGLSHYDGLNRIDKTNVVRLGLDQLSDIKELISISYPEAWIDDELVGLNENFGIYIDEKLISFAGIHCYSEQFEVAAIAHVTTISKYRGKGYAQNTVSSLLNSLEKNIKFIGLNVKVDNFSAINCYKKLGFKEYGTFCACEIKL